MSSLSQKQCIPCTIGTLALKGEKLRQFQVQINSEWKIVEEHHLEHEYKFKNFKEALKFTNKVGELAELQGHHPDIFLAWGRVKITLFTHKINGLSESDFIMAAKIDELK
ncbi:4a-hydroxytetrahydrobiopterin dehydratase [Candidatus Woesearchaeota archaeon]|nr:4a-hydroxytetrahydrobiopterin dehydratase [Candidatus Woesearchaeota archaeon]